MKIILNILSVLYAVVMFMFCAPVFSADIPLRWDANTEPDLAGYKLYYGTSSRTYGAPINVGNVTQYTLKGLPVGRTYYVAVTAYDLSGNESGFSNQVSADSTTGSYSVPELRVYIQDPAAGVLAYEWDTNTSDAASYKLYRSDSLDGLNYSPAIENLGNVNFHCVNIGDDNFSAGRIEALDSAGRVILSWPSAGWLAGNIVGDWRTGVAPESMRVFIEDLGLFATVFAKTVTHCKTPCGSSTSLCPAPSDLQTADFNKDGVINWLDLVYLALWWNHVPPWRTTVLAMKAVEDAVQAVKAPDLQSAELLVLQSATVSIAALEKLHKTKKPRHLGNGVEFTVSSLQFSQNGSKVLIGLDFSAASELTGYGLYMYANHPVKLKEYIQPDSLLTLWAEDAEAIAAEAMDFFPESFCPEAISPQPIFCDPEYGSPEKWEKSWQKPKARNLTYYHSLHLGAAFYNPTRNFGRVVIETPTANNLKIIVEK